MWVEKISRCLAKFALKLKLPLLYYTLLSGTPFSLATFGSIVLLTSHSGTSYSKVLLRNPPA